MHILITGGAGFIGTNLAIHLMQLGHQITAVDSLITGSDRNVKKLTEVGGDSFQFIKLDVISDEYKNLQLDKLDWVLNLACPASPPRYQADPIHTLTTCTMGLLYSLELARKHEAKLLQASTSEVYGDPSVSPQPESYHGNVNTVGVRSCYDEGKRVAETLCFEYKRQYGLDARIIRIFNTYGPYMDIKDGRVVTNFIQQALQNDPFTIYGEGNQTRSFQYIDDLVSGITKYIMLDEPFLGPINLGNPDEFTINELLQEVIALTGSRSEVRYEELPADDPTQRCPDISLAKVKLDWEPKIPLRDGLARTIAYFRHVIDSQLA